MDIINEYDDFSQLMVNYGKLYRDKYPNGLDLRPGHDDHDAILNRLLDRAQLGYEAIAQRVDSWRYMDDVLNVYMPMDETERKIKQKDVRKPVIVVVPESYSTLDTLLTYDVASYVKKPFLEYGPVGPEDVIAAMLLSFYTDYNIELFNLLLNFHTWWRDAKVYGVGVVGTYWTKEKIFRKKKQNFGDMIKSAFNTGATPDRRTHKEGNKMINFDPYNMLPDPGRPMEHAPKSRFFGWVEPGDRMNVLEMAADGGIFNLKYLAHMNCGESKFKNSGASGRKLQIGDNVSPIESDPFDIVHQYVQLIPSAWKLSDSDKPERWVFATVGDRVIIRAEKMDDVHNAFPIATIVPNFDGRTLLPLSPLEINSGMQGYLDWLLRSRVSAVRKGLVNTIVADPYMVNLLDFEQPGPIKYVRLTRAARGRPIDGLLKQLQFSDYTQNHLGDMSVIRNMMAESSASVDLTRGTQQRSGERITSTEISTRYRGAMSRLGKTGLFSAVMGHKPIAELFARNVINYAESPVFVKVTGEYTRQLVREFGLERRFSREFMKINPGDLDADFNVLTSIGDITWLQDSEVWLRMIELLVKQPVLQETFDIVRIFKHFGRIQGIKNVDDFVKPGVEFRTEPVENVINQRNAGNYVTGGDYATQTAGGGAQIPRAARGRAT